MARPMASSAAATVKMNITNAWPIGDLLNAANATKFKLPARSIISIAISMLMIDFLLYRTPKIPTEKTMAESIKKYESGTVTCDIDYEYYFYCDVRSVDI